VSIMPPEPTPSPRSAIVLRQDIGADSRRLHRRAARFDCIHRVRWALRRMLAAVLPLSKARRQGPASLVAHDGREQTLVCGPPGSGTGIGAVDERSEGWRRTFSRRSPFEPAAERSMRFNPLTEIRHGRPHDEWDARKLAEIVVSPDDGEEALESLMVALILHFFYAEADKSFEGIRTFLTDPARPVRGQLHRMLNTRHLSDGVHPVVASGARRALGLSPSERARVLARAVSSLSICREPQSRP
jgi:hypothetical protein